MPPASSLQGSSASTPRRLQPGTAALLTWAVVCLGLGSEWLLLCTVCWLGELTSRSRNACVCGLSQAQTQRDRATGRRPRREPCSVPKRGRHEAPPAPSQLQQGWTKEADGTCSYYTTLLPASGREQRAHGKVSGLRGLGNRERVWTLTLGFPGARPGLRRVHRPVPGRPGQRASDPHGHDLQIPPRQPANPPPFPFLVFFCCYCCRAVLRLAIIKNK